MTRAGEHLYLAAAPGDPLELSNGWEIEVEACAHFDKPLPHRAVAISLDPVTIRDVTSAFYSAYRDAKYPGLGPASTHIIRNGKAA